MEAVKEVEADTMEAVSPLVFIKAIIVHGRLVVRICRVSTRKSCQHSERGKVGKWGGKEWGLERAMLENKNTTYVGVHLFYVVAGWLWWVAPVVQSQY